MLQDTPQHVSIVFRAIFLCGIAVLLVLLFILLKPTPTQSQTTWTTPVKMYGWSWAGADGSGWISLNCETDTSLPVDSRCDSSNYGLSIKPDMTIEGFAWSSALGWIKFGNFRSFPEGSTGGNAKIDKATGKVTGWARVCNGTADEKCGTENSNTLDGWNGWISLSCENTGDCNTSQYGLVAENGRFSTSASKRFSWGEDPIGWIDWSAARWDMPCEPSLSCDAVTNHRLRTTQWCEVIDTGRLCDAAVPPVNLTDFSVTPTTVREGGVVSLTWRVENVSSCTVKGTNGDEWKSDGDGSNIASHGVQPIESSPLTHQTDFYIECSDLEEAPSVELDRIPVRVVPTIIEY